MAASRSDALVLFGVTGDLAHKMIFPALYAMAKRGALKIPIIGVAFPKWNLARLHKRVTDSIKRSDGIDKLRPILRPVMAALNEPEPAVAAPPGVNRLVSASAKEKMRQGGEKLRNSGA